MCVSTNQSFDRNFQHLYIQWTIDFLPYIWPRKRFLILSERINNTIIGLNCLPPARRSCTVRFICKRSVSSLKDESFVDLWKLLFQYVTCKFCHHPLFIIKLVRPLITLNCTNFHIMFIECTLSLYSVRNRKLIIYSLVYCGIHFMTFLYKFLGASGNHIYRIIYSVIKTTEVQW